MHELDLKLLHEADRDSLPLGIRTIYEKEIGDSQREKRIYRIDKFGANKFVIFALEKPISRI
jgi:hypothetical protein